MSSVKWRPFCLSLNVLNDMGVADAVHFALYITPLISVLLATSVLVNVMIVNSVLNIFPCPTPLDK